ncbi:MAG TPA: DUF2339 domain-containing protein [Vicinamibacterales bacterium]|nr:DUF2339 domain-containing protein [Vicinamibacterales bacterium]
MELLFAAALFVVAVIPGWMATAWLLWRVRALRRAVDALGARVSHLQAQGVESEPTASPALTPTVPVIDAAPVAVEDAHTSVGQPPPPARPRATRPHDGETLESWIGGQWLLYIGVLAILIGVAYFEKLAFESAWLGETARVAQGAVAGLALVYGGSRFARSGYSGYGHAIAGAGIAAIYVSIYASFNFYHLIDRGTAFVLMLAVTAAATALADRQRSQGLAVLSVGGGYLTPFLLPGTSDAQVALFGYDAILAGGASALAVRRTWPLLYATSYIGTAVTLAAWADRFYTPAKYLRTELFLTLFCAMFVWMLRRCRWRGPATEQVASLFLVTAPIAYYLASVAILMDHTTAWLVWMVATAAVGAVVAVRRAPGWGLLLSVAVLVPFLLWCDTPAARAHLIDGLSAAAGIYLLALAAQLRIGTGRTDLSATEILWLHLNGLGIFAAAYLLLLHDHLALTAAAAAAFALWQAGVALTIRARAPEQALHVGALALTLTAIAIALEFDGAAVTIGWAVEALAITAMGRQTRREWLRTGGVILFAIAFVRAVSLLLEPPVVHQSVLLNRRAACALVLIAIAYAIAWLHRSSGRRERGAIRTTGILAAQVLTILWFTSEIRAYWSVPQSALTRELMLSVTWAAYATTLVVVGLRRQFAPLRIFAMVVLALTIAKVFTVDLAQLQRVYRVASMLGLGVMLLLTSYLYQKSRAGTRIGSPEPNGDEGESTAH